MAGTVTDPPPYRPPSPRGWWGLESREEGEKDDPALGRGLRRGGSLSEEEEPTGGGRCLHPSTTGGSTRCRAGGGSSSDEPRGDSRPWEPSTVRGGGCRRVHLLGRLKPHTQRPGPCALRCRRQPVPLVAQGAAVFNALTSRHARRARRRSVCRAQYARGAQTAS